jgi:hypothetical protein
VVPNVSTYSPTLLTAAYAAESVPAAYVQMAFASILLAPVKPATPSPCAALAVLVCVLQLWGVQVHVQSVKRHAQVWLIAQSLLTVKLGTHVPSAHAVHEMCAFWFPMPAQILLRLDACLLGVREQEPLLQANPSLFILQ